MKQKQALAVLCAAACFTAVLSGCTSERNGSTAETGETSSAAETGVTEVTTAETAPETTVTETETTAETTDTTTETEPDAETMTVPADGSAGLIRILWSERGLEAVGAEGEGYGEELTVGAEYLDWKLEAYDGSSSGQSVAELNADFTYNGTLSVNGIVSVLPADDPDNPNMLYLRVDNQADFPYFPSDTRERGWFIIENSGDVFKMLELDDPPVASKYEVAVSVTVTELHIHLRPDGYDTIHVTAASKR